MMRAMRWITVMLVAAAVVGLTGAATGRGAARQTSVESSPVAANCTRVWVVDKRPEGAVNSVAVDASGVWAAGSISGGPVLRFDGKRWSSMRIPGVPEIVDLAVGQGSVWALAPTDVYRWTGKGWQRLVVTGLPKARNGLSFRAIDVAAEDVWLVGTYDNSTYGKTGDWGSRWLTARLHGGRWRAYPAPLATYAGLSGVEALSAGDAWAVGAQGPSMADAQDVMLHWNGSEWVDMSKYDYVFRLNDVLALAPNDAWAVGDTNFDAFPEAQRRPAIEHWNGTRWLRVNMPNWRWPTAPNLNTLAALGPQDVWAGGKRVNGPPTLLHWDGEHWTEAIPPPVKTAILDLAAARDGTLWAVGKHFVAHSRCK